MQGNHFIDDFFTPSSVHQSAALDNIEKVLKDLEINISSAIKDRNRNLTELREQKLVITEQIKEKRQKINTLLDQLEGVLLEKASAMEKEYCRKIEEVITKLEDAKERVDEIRNDVESVKMCASNLQMFMGTKAFQESVSTNETNIRKLDNNGSLNTVTIECKFNGKMDRVIKEIKTLGDIKMNNCDKHVSFFWKGGKSTQILKPVSGAKSFGEIIAKLVRRINIGRNNLTGCVLSEAGNMLFVQANKNKLLKYESNGQFHSESCIIPGQNHVGYDLAVVDSNLVGVSSGGHFPQKIHFIDINNAKVRKEIILQDWCYGLSYHNGIFICCTHNNGIKLYDTLSQKLNNMQILPNAPKHVNETYVTSNEKGIFHSNWRDNSVICYDYNGQVQWTYTDSLLKNHTASP
ncbi:unnamed protein product [Mytilus coruscus]|uniref:Uncharacterized protein n=1 Tax=Mytilus coruscus TaxID=42192 RepID=A0A6J8DKU2_MYTCO|nr:unnamed protein product [Mytilus coruscus]